MQFSEFALDAQVLRAIELAGYTEPTPIQAAAIPEILAGHDVTGIAQTGTGKTAAFTLPILSRMAPKARQGQGAGTRTLILSPTRELAVQIEENLRVYARGVPVRIGTVFGGVGENPQIQALRSGTHIIIACPGRLLDLMGRRCGDFSRLEYLVLDEADRMLDMGFLPSIRNIVRRLPSQRQTLLFSATLSREIEGLTSEFQRNPKLIQIGRRSNPAETVTQWVHEVPKALKSALLLHLLADPQMNMVLVFARMKHGADRIARALEQKGIPTGVLHSNRSQSQRTQALQAFKSGAVRVLVATDIASRGIDVDGISHVINYDFPMNPEDYVHRIGRTGRAQSEGDAITFVAPEESGDLRALERFLGRSIHRKPAEGFDLRQPHPVGESRGRGGRNGGSSGGGGRGGDSHRRRPQEGRDRYRDDRGSDRGGDRDGYNRDARSQPRQGGSSSGGSGRSEHSGRQGGPQGRSGDRPQRHGSEQGHDRDRSSSRAHGAGNATSSDQGSSSSGSQGGGPRPFKSSMRFAPRGFGRRRR